MQYSYQKILSQALFPRDTPNIHIRVSKHNIPPKEVSQYREYSGKARGRSLGKGQIQWTSALGNGTETVQDSGSEAGEQGSKELRVQRAW